LIWLNKFHLESRLIPFEATLEQYYDEFMKIKMERKTYVYYLELEIGKLMMERAMSAIMI